MLIVKVLDSSGSGNASDVQYGMEWAVDHGAKVLNVSIGSSVPFVTTVTGNPLVAGIDYAYQHNVAVAVAAGNSGLPLNDYSLLSRIQHEALVVGGLTRTGAIASYSNAGANVYAPGGDGSGTIGGDVVSTTKGAAYASGAGTSFAAPHVAGVFALLMSKGMGSQQAHDTILAHLATATTSGAQLDAAAALGVSPTATCGNGTTQPGGGGHTTSPGGSHTPAGPGGTSGSPQAPAGSQVAGASPSASGSAEALKSGDSPSPGGASTQTLTINPAGGGFPPALFAIAGVFAAGAAAATYIWLRQAGRV
jgi:subtilisin family serine protease